MVTSIAAAEYDVDVEQHRLGWARVWSPWRVQALPGSLGAGREEMPSAR
jgi:hypothetical protein